MPHKPDAGYTHSVTLSPARGSSQGVTSLGGWEDSWSLFLVHTVDPQVLCEHISDSLVVSMISSPFPWPKSSSPYTKDKALGIAPQLMELTPLGQWWPSQLLQSRDLVNAFGPHTRKAHKPEQIG